MFPTPSWPRRSVKNNRPNTQNPYPKLHKLHTRSQPSTSQLQHHPLRAPVNTPQAHPHPSPRPVITGHMKTSMAPTIEVNRPPRRSIDNASPARANPVGTTSSSGKSGAPLTPASSSNASNAIRSISASEVCNLGDQSKAAQLKHPDEQTQTTDSSNHGAVLKRLLRGEKASWKYE